MLNFLQHSAPRRKAAHRMRQFKKGGGAVEPAMTSLETEVFSAEREWTVDGIPVLTVRIALPEPVGQEPRLAPRVRRYYHAQCGAHLRYCGRQLFPQAAAACRAALETSAPLPCFHAELDFRVTYNENGFWSLYTQSREPGPDGRTLLRRWGDTWDLRTGYPAPISAFFPPRSGWRKTLLTLAAEEIRRQEAAGHAQYFPNWRRMLRRHFNPRSFYLTDGGLTFFYPMYAIAPAMEGIPVFTLPWNSGLVFTAPPKPEA